MSASRPVVHVFCDESHTSPFSYRVQGGMWVPDVGMRVVREEFAKLRQRHPSIGEIGWSELRGTTLRTVYRDAADLFFCSPAAPFLSFKCLVVADCDDAGANLSKHERELGFYRAYWTFLRFRLHRDYVHHVRLDERSSPLPEPEIELMRCVNHTGYNDGRDHDAILTCHQSDSKEEDLLQLADLFCGAIGWVRNGRKSTAHAKHQFEAHVSAYLKWPDLSYNTGMSARKFNVWKFTPKKNKPG